MSFQIQEPAAKRKTLAVTAGIVWLTVGVALTLMAVFWLAASQSRPYLLVGAAVVVGLLVGRYGFSRLAKKNITRIRDLSPHKERVCIFAFQAVESYLLVVVMMAAGYVLRHLPIPHTYVAGVYLVIGTALFRSGLEYIKAAGSL